MVIPDTLQHTAGWHDPSVTVETRQLGVERVQRHGVAEAEDSEVEAADLSHGARADHGRDVLI